MIGRTMQDAPQPQPGVFIVDDSSLVRESLRLMLTHSGFEVRGEAGAVLATFDHPALNSASVVILDIWLGQSSALDAIPALCRRGLRVLVFSMEEDGHVVRRALEAGATGYVTKREAGPSLASALHRVAAGVPCVSARVAVAVARRSVPAS